MACGRWRSAGTRSVGNRAFAAPDRSMSERTCGVTATLSQSPVTSKTRAGVWAAGASAAEISAVTRRVRSGSENLSAKIGLHGRAVERASDDLADAVLDDDLSFRLVEGRAAALPVERGEKRSLLDAAQGVLEGDAHDLALGQLDRGAALGLPDHVRRVLSLALEAELALGPAGDPSRLAQGGEEGRDLHVRIGALALEVDEAVLRSPATGVPSGCRHRNPRARWRPRSGPAGPARWRPCRRG